MMSFYLKRIVKKKSIIGCAKFFCILQLYNFVNELNRMQSEVDIDLDNTSVFFKKTTIPIYFYNLILLRFGVEVVE